MGCKSSKNITTNVVPDHHVDSIENQNEEQDIDLKTSSNNKSLVLPTENDASPLAAVSEGSTLSKKETKSKDVISSDQKSTIPFFKDIKDGHLNKESLLERITEHEKIKVIEFVQHYDKVMLDEQGEQNKHQGNTNPAIIKSNNLLYPNHASALRSIRHTNYNVDKAVKLYRSFANWHHSHVLMNKRRNSNNFMSEKGAATSKSSEAVEGIGDVDSGRDELSDEKRGVLEACYFQYFAPGHCRRGCPIKVQATGRWAVSRMKACGVTSEDFLRYHIESMETHRKLISMDQATVGSKFVRDDKTGELLPVPLHPERGVLVICDIRACSLSAFYEASNLIGSMIEIDKPNYYESMDRMLIIHAPYALTHIAWPIVKPLLSKDVTERVQVLSGDMTEALLEYIDEDNLPLEFQKKQPVKPSLWPSVSTNQQQEESSVLSTNNTRGDRRNHRVSTTLAGELANQQEATTMIALEPPANKYQKFSMHTPMNQSQITEDNVKAESSLDNKKHEKGVDILVSETVTSNKDDKNSPTTTTTTTSNTPFSVPTSFTNLQQDILLEQSSHFELWTAELIDAYEPKCQLFKTEEEVSHAYNEKWATTRLLIEVILYEETTHSSLYDAAAAAADDGNVAKNELPPSICIEENAADAVMNVFALDALRAAVYAKHTQASLEKAGKLQEHFKQLHPTHHLVASTDKVAHHHHYRNHQLHKSHDAKQTGEKEQKESENKMKNRGNEEEEDALAQISSLLAPVFSGLSSVIFTNEEPPTPPTSTPLSTPSLTPPGPMRRSDSVSSPTQLTPLSSDFMTQQHITTDSVKNDLGTGVSGESLVLNKSHIREKFQHFKSKSFSDYSGEGNETDESEGFE